MFTFNATQKYLLCVLHHHKRFAKHLFEDESMNPYMCTSDYYGYNVCMNTYI